MSFKILECRKFTAECKNPVKRDINHYELDFYLGGEREIIIDGRESKITEGTICFRRPGQTAQSFGDYNCYVSTLSFSDAISSTPFSRNAPDVIEPSVLDPLIDNIPDVIITTHKNEILSCFSYICEMGNVNSEAAKNAMLRILFLINADVARMKYEVKSPSESPAEKALKYINENYDQNINLDSLAYFVNLDKSYLVRLFKSKYGSTPIEYLIDYRLYQARTFLLNTDMTVTEISERCGFNSSSYFISQYKKKFGCTPSESRL